MIILVTPLLFLLWRSSTIIKRNCGVVRLLSAYLYCGSKSWFVAWDEGPSFTYAGFSASLEPLWWLLCLEVELVAVCRTFVWLKKLQWNQLLIL